MNSLPPLTQQGIAKNPTQPVEPPDEQRQQGANVTRNVTTELSISSYRKVEYSDETGFSRSEERSVSLTYSSNGTVDGVAEEAPQRTQEAENILTFIGGQLRRDFAEGASAEALGSRLQAGLDGFVDGYTQAFNQLNEAGLLSEDVTAAIGETYQGVLSGIEELALELGIESPVTDALKNKFSDVEINDAPAPLGPPEGTLPQPVGLPTTSPVELQPLETVAPKERSRTQIISSLQASFRETIEVEKERIAERVEEQKGVDLGAIARADTVNYSYTEKNSFDFSLTTADGDTVSLSVRADSASSAERNRSDASTRYEVSGAQSGSLFFEVDGELDEDELRAINDLIGQIGDLAESFFSGNVFDAYEKALEVGFDSEEIAGFSLNLRQEKVTQVEAVYSPIANLPVGGSENESPREVRDPKLEQLSNLIKMLDEIRLESKELGVDRNDIVGLGDYLANTRFKDEENKDEFAPFVSSLLGDLDALES